MRTFGQINLLIAFVATGYAAVATYLGWYARRTKLRHSGVALGLLGFGSLTLTLIALLHALLTHDFRLDYVAQYTNRTLPWHYLIASLWVGQAGSLLLWSWLAGLVAAAFFASTFTSGDDLREPAFAVMMGYVCFLVAIMVFAVDPMAASTVVPQDGVGLSPILQHPAMMIHPPIVFLSYACWTVPFALGIAVLLAGESTASWIRMARPWALFAWSVLGTGILVGAYWAYRELGWGGYWAWDPVENASLIPWLLGTAAIHTLMAWRHRGMFKKSSLALNIATFGMCNFASFLTRSGIFSSLHAFSQSPIGWSFLGLMAILTVVGMLLIWYRRRELQAERSVASLWCRESVIALSSIALTAFSLLVCVGTVSTAVSNALVGRSIVLGVGFYNSALIPTGLFVLGGTAAAPLLRWGAAPSKAQRHWLQFAILTAIVFGVARVFASDHHGIAVAVESVAVFAFVTLIGCLYLDAAKFEDRLASGLTRAVRVYRRPYAGFVVHGGLFCLAIGVAASSLNRTQLDTTLHPGDVIQWNGRRIELIRVVQHETTEKLIVEAHLRLQHGNGPAAICSPAQHFHRHSEEWTTETSVSSSWRDDFYAILHSGHGQDGVQLTFAISPMMRWIWLGGGIIGLGSAMAIWPSPHRTRRSEARTAKRPKFPVSRRHATIAAKAAAVLLLVNTGTRSLTLPSSQAEVPSHSSPGLTD